MLTPFQAKISRNAGTCLVSTGAYIMKRRCPDYSSLLASLVLALGSVAATAQLPLLVFDGQQQNGYYGRSVAGAGDVNNDGWPDLLVGGDIVQVFSGRDGTELLRVTGIQSPYGSGLQFVASVGDVNQDRHADFIVGERGYTGGAGRARVFSGRDRSTLFAIGGTATSSFGFSVAGAGDVDHDGVPDFIVGAPFDDSWKGAAHVYSGSDGRELFTFRGNSGSDLMGHSVSSCGDINNDGHSDLLVGAVRNVGGCPNGFVRIYSGNDGTLIRQLSGTGNCDYFGFAASGVGDANGDGYPDLLVGAPNYLAANATMRTGAAFLISGRDGATLHQFTGSTPDGQFGWAVSGAGDVDGDGCSDVIVGSGGFLGSAATLISGKTGSVIHEFSLPGTGLGYSVAGCGDIDRNGIPDLIAGAPEDSRSAPRGGSAHVFGMFPPATFTAIGTGCSGSAGVPVLTAASVAAPWIGESFTVELSQFPSGVLSIPFGLLGFSDTTWGSLGLPLSLDLIGMPTCQLLVSIDATFVLGNEGGHAYWTIRIPVLPSLVANSFYLQGFVLDRAANALGATVTNAGEARIGVR